jgi:hypothetical protein
MHSEKVSVISYASKNKKPDLGFITKWLNVSAGIPLMETEGL